MAERRMFHASVVGSDAFMDLPVGAQALYFHLGMQADDDGFVNCPKQVARRLRRPPKELRLLTDSGFLLEFDGIVVLRHWLVGNTLRQDRMKPLNYPTIASRIYIMTNKEYSLEAQGECKTLEEKRKGILSDNCPPKVREGKVSKEKIKEDKIRQVSVSQDPLGEEGLAPAHTPDTENQLKLFSGKLGKGVVYLSDSQVEDLLEKLELDGFDVYVERLANFIIKNNAKVANHYATILKWWEQDKGVRK